MGSENGSESKKHLISHTEAAFDEGYLLTPDKKFGTSSSSSSDTSDSSREYIFEEDGNELSKFTIGNTASPKLDDAAVQLTLKDSEGGFTSNYSPISELSDQGSSGLFSPGLLSPPGASGLYMSMHYESATQSPPVQLMGQPESSSSYRIPSSVFARSKSKTPLEWSVASNESLFSIHVGNNSFSRDHMFLFSKSGELGKSGELTKADELMMNFPISPLRPAATTDTNHKRVDWGGLGVTEAAAETMKAVLKAAAEDHDKEKNPPAVEVRNSSNISYHSEGSVTSIHSFAFPILTADERRIGSSKAGAEQHLSQSHTPGPTPKAAKTKWFQCFRSRFCF